MSELTMPAGAGPATPAGAGPAPRLEFAFAIRLRFTRVQMIPGMPSGATRGALPVSWR